MFCRTENKKLPKLSSLGFTVRKSKGSRAERKVLYVSRSLGKKTKGGEGSAVVNGCELMESAWLPLKR